MITFIYSLYFAFIAHFLPLVPACAGFLSYKTTSA